MYSVLPRILRSAAISVYNHQSLIKDGTPYMFLCLSPLCVK